MKSRIVQIGNAYRIQLPKALLKRAGVTDEIEISAYAGTIIISVQKPRTGWAEAARLAHARGDDVLLDENLPSHSDDNERNW